MWCVIRKLHFSDWSKTGKLQNTKSLDHIWPSADNSVKPFVNWAIWLLHRRLRHLGGFEPPDRPAQTWNCVRNLHKDNTVRCWQVTEIFIERSWVYCNIKTIIHNAGSCCFEGFAPSMQCKYEGQTLRNELTQSSTVVGNRPFAQL